MLHCRNQVLIKHSWFPLINPCICFFPFNGVVGWGFSLEHSIYHYPNAFWYTFDWPGFCCFNSWLSRLLLFYIEIFTVNLCVPFKPFSESSSYFFNISVDFRALHWTKSMCACLVMTRQVLKWNTTGFG